MTFQQFLLIIRARHKIVIFIFLLTVAITIIISLVLTKQYTANSAVVVDVKSPDPMSGQILQGLATAGYMSTQIDIINSDRTAKAVVKSLGIEENPEFRQLWVDAADGKGQFVDWLVNILQKNLDVKPSKDSNVISINYTGTDPNFVAATANAFAQAYMDVNLDLRLATARQYAVFFEDQTKAAREKLELAQRALSDYQQKNGITSAEQQVDFETTKLNETSSQLTGVQGQTTDSQSKRQNSKADTLPEVMQSPLINGLKADIARLEASLMQNNINLGKNHPQTLRSEAELATLKKQLGSETRNITISIDTAYQVGKQREQQLQIALADQKAHVLVLNKQRDELNVLRRDIESAQRTFEAASQRAAQTNMESQANQTNISLLSPAVIPTKPSSPRVIFNTLVSIFLGMLLGVGVTLVLELIHRRIRCSDDISKVLGLPMLGTITSAADMFKHTKGTHT